MHTLGLLPIISYPGAVGIAGADGRLRFILNSGHILPTTLLGPLREGIKMRWILNIFFITMCYLWVHGTFIG